MTTTLPTPVSAAPAPGAEPATQPTESQLARAEAKQLKKQRKAERLQFFFGWCQGCRAFGNGF